MYCVMRVSAPSTDVMIVALMVNKSVIDDRSGTDGQ